MSFGLFLAKGRQHHGSEAIVSGFSRESLFVGNNVLLTVACACVLLGTLYPLATEALTPLKITVGAPYFNAVMVPIMLAIVLLMAIGPLLPWRKANAQKLYARFKYPLPVALIVAVW